MANNNHFNLTLDTLAPTGSITIPATYINANKALNISRNSEDAVLMKVWRNKAAEGTKDDAEYPTSWEVFGSKDTNFVGKDDEGAWYYHLQLMDSVNNESVIYNTDVIYWDITNPNITALWLEDLDSGSKNYTNELTVKYHIAWTDSSPIVSAKFSGTDVGGTESPISSAQSPVEGQLTFTTSGDGVKKVLFTLVDAAGNTSTREASISYTGTANKPTIILTNASSTPLPEFIKYHDIKVTLKDSDTNILNYKIWEGDNEPEDWVVWQTEGEAGGSEARKLDVTIDHTLSVNDGLKTLHAKVENIAHTVVEADPASVTVDTVVPTVTLSSNKTIISNISGYEVAELSLYINDASAGIKSWDLLCGDTSIKGSLVELPSTFELTSINSLVEGTNVIKLVATDNAENTNYATVEVILDITKPTISSTSLDTYQWFTSKPGITVSSSDINGVAKIEAWINDISEDFTPGSGTIAVLNPSATQIISSDKVGGTVLNMANMYAHIKVTDVVGNANYAHARFGFDDVKPTSTVKFSEKAYSTTNASLIITYDDNVSGVAKMRITGDIENPTAGSGDDQWEIIASTRAVTLSGDDGMKSVSIIVKDVAGNIQEVAATAECELDRTEPTASVLLYDIENTTPKEAVSCIDGFCARISVTDDTFGSVYYKIYGDFATSQGQSQGVVEPEEWTVWTADSGQKYLTVPNLYCTTGDGVKYVYIKVKDEAGHEIGVDPAISASFIYDTTAPEITTLTHDYAMISKVHANRISGGETISSLESYADEVKIEFVPNDYIQAYKICAYMDASAALAGYPTAGTREEKNAWIENQVSIPQTGDVVEGLVPSSTNMHATGLNQNTKINSIIKGADYEYALGGVSNTGEYDGAHIIVIYVQDRAGTWSAAADFSK